MNITQEEIAAGTTALAKLRASAPYAQLTFEEEVRAVLVAAAQAREQAAVDLLKNRCE